MRLRSLLSFWFLPLLLLGASACTRKKPVWIYTNLPKEVVAEMDPILRLAIPGCDPRWYHDSQDGLSTKLEREISEGKTQADILLTSDPLWFVKLKQEGKLLARETPVTREVPREFVDPDLTFATAKISLLVLAYNSDKVRPEQLPERWTDLMKPQWQGKLTMPNPFESALAFVGVAQLGRTKGWEYFSRLRALGINAAGGAAASLSRIESGERPVGIAILDHVLRSQARGSPVRAIYPHDGAIIIPSPIAIVKQTKDLELIGRVHDWFFSPAAQNAMIHASFYSPLPKVVSPDNARPWSSLKGHLAPWTQGLWSELYLSRDQIRAQYSASALR